MATPILTLALTGTRLADGSYNAGGSVYCYLPGTTSEATVYSDPEAASALTQPVTLGAYGEATIYTKTVVDLVVRDANGTTLKTLYRANGLHSAQVDVENAGFLGVNSLGQTVAGPDGRGSLDSLETKALSAWNGTDFKYKATTSATARAPYLVLKERGLAPQDYGAVGSGLVDDYAAFAAAIAVIKAAGGGILYVPPGTYLLSAALVVDFSGLRIIGAGQNVSILKMTGSADVITVTGAYNFDVSDIQITASNIIAAGAIVSQGQGCVFRNVKVTPHFSTCIDLSTGSFSVEISHCNLRASAAGASCIAMLNTGTSAIDIFGCYLEGSSGGEGIGVYIGAGPVSSVDIHNNYFGSLDTGIEIASTATGKGYRISSNYMRDCTEWLTVGSVAANIHLRTWCNDYGTATITDNQYSIISASPGLQLNSGEFYRVNPVALNDIAWISKKPVGTVITLVINGGFANDIKHATGTVPAGFATILLDGSADWVNPTQNSSISFVFDGGAWVETGRQEA